MNAVNAIGDVLLRPCFPLRPQPCWVCLHPQPWHKSAWQGTTSGNSKSADAGTFRERHLMGKVEVEVPSTAPSSMIGIECSQVSKKNNIKLSDLALIPIFLASQMPSMHWRTALGTLESHSTKAFRGSSGLLFHMCRKYPPVDWQIVFVAAILHSCCRSRRCKRRHESQLKTVKLDVKPTRLQGHPGCTHHSRSYDHSWTLKQQLVQVLQHKSPWKQPRFRRKRRNRFCISI